MNDTAVVATDLDRLAERVERAAALIGELRSRNGQLENEKTQLHQERTQALQDKTVLQRRLEETEGRLQGQDPAQLVAELAALQRAQRDWLAEKRDVAARIEAISAKLERLE
jgi:chromosome segregation ATPase